MVEEVEPVLLDAVEEDVREELAGAEERLVAARKAEDILLLVPPAAEPVEEPSDDEDPPALVLPPLFEATCWLPAPPKFAVLAAESRPVPDRLPRICGTTIDTNRSAPVVPDKRMLLSSRSLTAGAVRTSGPAVPEVSCFAACNQYQAPAPIIASRPRPHIHARLGRSLGGDAGGTTCGSGGCGDGNGSGLGDALDADIAIY